MSNLKIVHGSQPGPESRGPGAPNQSRSANPHEHSPSASDKTYAHDNTPARQREVESQGHHTRAQVEGHSDERGSHSNSLLGALKFDGGAGRHSGGVDARGSGYGSKFSADPGSDHGEGKRSHAGQPDGEFSFKEAHNLDDGPGRSLRNSGEHQSPAPQVNDSPGFKGKANFAEGDGPGRGPRNAGEYQSPARQVNDSPGFKGKANFAEGDGPGRGPRNAGEYQSPARQVNDSLNFKGKGNLDDGDGRSRSYGSNQARTEAFNSQGKGHSPINSEGEPGRFLGDRRGGDARSYGEKDETHAGGHRADDELFSNTLNGARRTLGETIRTVSDQLRAVARDARSASQGPTYNYADRLISQANYAMETRLSQGVQPERIARQIIPDVISVSQLTKHFLQLENTGGEPARQAYRAVMEFLLGRNAAEGYDRLRFATELLRDLQSGLFLYEADLEGPFPLTGRARLVSEMIALMRTLDAIETFAARVGNSRYDLPPLLPTGGVTGSELIALLEQLLADSSPMLPGLAGRLEIPRMVAALGGLLNDAEGNPLLMFDGKQQKVGELLWLNTLANNTSWVADKFEPRLSPAFVYGFDSIFSLIGFDGRAPLLPRFVAIQSQINAFEWVYGQAPLNEAWMRSAIELLKDSRIFDHNVLGEMLEEALTTGRFHMAVMRGTVEEGKPVSGSFSFTPVYNFNPAVSAAMG